MADVKSKASELLFLNIADLSALEKTEPASLH